jgi:hypothetical protein
VGSNPIARSKSLSDLAGKGGRSETRLSAECPRNVFPARSGEYQLFLPQAGEAGSKSSECPPRHDTPFKNWVRERPTAPARPQDYQRPDKGPAHASNRLVVQLNANWRLVDEPLQWMLQRRQGNPRDKNSGWRGRSFCRTREALLRCVHEYCGDVEPAALAKLAALPSHHGQSEELEATEAENDRSRAVAETSNGISRVSDVLRAHQDVQ